MDWSSELEVKPTDNELHLSVTAWILYFGIPDTSLSFSFPWADQILQKTLPISCLCDKALVGNILGAKQK